ncbi:MAG: bifunctional ornithine acetyltransferase/N-acetylglutamate synthase, partial [Gammaproteobacteria bacterium]|nr:bifunctional ornithine acetyltransferase/N-acetylglutamate synthase [Gammaproteobacteria bacterium]
GIENLNINEIEIFLGDVCVVRNGGRADDYTEERGQAVMSQTDIPIQIKLNRGNSQIQIWTCDFSYDYVKINAEYRT